MKMTKIMKQVEPNYRVGDFYWAYADILRGVGINETVYDQRILAFMALKLLVDNNKLQFNFDWRNNFGLSKALYAKYQGRDTRETFINIINDIENLGQNLAYFIQPAYMNPSTDNEDKDALENCLKYLNHKKTFALGQYIEELEEPHYVEMVLDIYVEKAHFVGYPKEQYKDLYETTIARMKRLTGELTGQHFTQKSIIHLMCETAIASVQANNKIAIYDPTCGVASMLIESAYYFDEKINRTSTGRRKKSAKEIEVYGQEYNGQTWLLAKIFLEISSLDGDTSGVKNQIAYGNTLINPIFANGINGEESFDFIIANPPFGVDWKHDYKKVVENMEREDSDFFVIRDEKGKIVLPKKSDGQFLFMLHIINLMNKEKARGKQAKAGIISSSPLIASGSQTSSEALIRKTIFNEGIVHSVIEQPQAMFTNTDISSHIWFLDTDISDTIKVLKVDNDVNTMFSMHPSPKDKMKHAYSAENIQTILSYINQTKDTKYISKTVYAKNTCDINIYNEVGKMQKDMNLDIFALEEEYKNAIETLYMMGIV